MHATLLNYLSFVAYYDKISSLIDRTSSFLMHILLLEGKSFSPTAAHLYAVILEIL